MAARLCHTVDEAFEAGWNEACDHGADPGTCPTCRLTEAEISRLVVLLSGLAEPVPTRSRAA